MQVEDVMTKEVCRCSPDATARVALGKMWANDIGVLPVVEGDRVVGMVTDRDIAMAAFLNDRRPSDLRVREITANRVWAVAPGDPVERAEELMREHQVRRLPVIDRGCLVGMVTLGDLAHARQEVPRRDVARTLDEITARRVPIEGPPV